MGARVTGRAAARRAWAGHLRGAQGVPVNRTKAARSGAATGGAIGAVGPGTAKRAGAKKATTQGRLEGYLADTDRVMREDASVPDSQTIQITPVPKPRMSQRDKWHKRPSVVRYRMYCDQLRLNRIRLPHAYRLHFVLPMPESWPEEFKTKMDGKPHLLKPDCSNLVKAVEDALVPNDEALHAIAASKTWGREGRLIVEKVRAPILDAVVSVAKEC